MFRVKFKYRDHYTRGRWVFITLQCSTVRECIERVTEHAEICGADDCEYQVLGVDEAPD